MSQNINVDREKLSAFTSELTDFQDKLNQRLQALQDAWETCSQSWQGDSKDSFLPGFETMIEETSSAFESGNSAVDYLEQYNSLLEEFEEG